jgi:hypothetical protein
VLGADGCARTGLELPAGVSYLVAVTVAGEQAVVGRSTRVIAAPPVSDLRAERYDSVVRLSWVWPERTARAVVTWWDTRALDYRRASGTGGPGGAGDAGSVGVAEGVGGTGGTGGVGLVAGPASGSERGSRLSYEAEGGFEAPMGSGPLLVAVRTAVPTGAGESLSPPVLVRVPGKAVLEYRVAPVGLLRREREVHLDAEEECDMPEVAVVYTPGRVQPHSAEQGRVLAVFPARRMSAGERVSVRVRPPRGSGPAWLMCFPLDGGTVVRLRQPPVKELRL